MLADTAPFDASSGPEAGTFAPSWPSPRGSSSRSAAEPRDAAIFKARPLRTATGRRFAAGALAALVVAFSGCDGDSSPTATEFAGSPNFGSEIVATTPVAYPDQRPAPAYRLDAEDAGVVLKHGDPSDLMGARDVYVYEADGSFYMNYDGATSTGWIAAQAKSSDLVHWQKSGSILTLGEAGASDSASASYGTVYYDGNTYHMFYLGTPNTTGEPYLVPAFPYLTMKATSMSPSGPFVKDYNVTPFTITPDTYYSHTASPGQIVYQDGTYLQFFSATNSVNQRSIGIARTTDLDGAWQPGPKPAIPPAEQVENSSLYYQDSTKTWFMFVNHVGVGYTDAIWVYWSQDVQTWDPANKAVVLDASNCTWSNMIVGLPSIVSIDNRLAIFYDGQAEPPPAGSDLNLLHMNRDIGLAWLDLPIRTP